MSDRRRDRDRDRDKDRHKDKHRDKKRRSRSPVDRRRSRSPSDRRDRRDRDYDKREKSRKEDKRDRELDKQREEEELQAAEEQRAKEAMQAQLEEQMKERRDRVEQWRQDRQRREERLAAEAAAAANANNENENTVNGENGHANGEGILEEDGESDDEAEEEEIVEAAPIVEEANGTTNENENMEVDEDDDDVDPLDAFMADLTKSAKSEEPTAKARVVVIKKTDGPNKGDIIDNEEDAERPSDDFDIQEAASSLMAKSRHFTITDHNRIYYKPFRRDFYIEVPELQKMTKKEVDLYRESLDGIKVRGKNCPKPLKNWAQAGVELKVLNILKRNKYEKPTPIQAQAIPAIMSGRDVIGIAKTGSGKTLAFLLPMFRHILDQDPVQDMDGPIGIVMSPTRELALQTYKEANKFCHSLNLRVVCVYGGVGISDQIADLKKGAEIVVCTPGRMIDMLAANNGRVTNLRRCTYLVLDEADRMFDMGFEPQVMKVINNVRPDRQTVLFSATFPKQMEALARKVLVKPVEIQVGGRSVVCADIEQHALIVEEHVKYLKLLELLGQYYELGNVLVFVDKQEKADDLVSQLMAGGYNCAPLHGGIDQFDRDSTLIDFKLGKLKLMVATSVAARGLDVKKLILVVNYDCPNHYEDYVHRVGRTGRAGNRGYAYTFVLPVGQEKMSGEVCRAFETAGVEPPAELKAMYEKFCSQMAEKGVKIQSGGGGFSGSGYRYDDAEDQSEANRRKLTKLVHGLEAGGDDDDDDIEQQLNSIMKCKSRVITASDNAPAPPGIVFDAPSTSTKLTRAEQQAAESKVTAAKAAAERIAAQKQLGAIPIIEKDATALTAEAVMKGEVAKPIKLSATALAKQKAEALNSKLQYLPSAMNPADQSEDNMQYFEEELEINDFPQQLRYKVCSRESIAQVQEFADVGISVKGTHYPPGREPKEGQDRKLYLLLEARDTMSIRRGREEVLRIMKDTLRQMTQSGVGRGATGGRYRLF